MGSLEVGRVVMKIAGREAGKYAVVVKAAGKEKGEKNFVVITGPKLLTGVKRRKCNVSHLEPLPYVLEIKEDASDEEVLAAFEKANLINKLGLKKPSAAELKAEKEVEQKKEEKKTKKEKKK
ncbi:MAG: 50S ribosomal protein L14e [Candidatus Aenigmatarchaeota archaeon]